jgi:hypothetical protein
MPRINIAPVKTYKSSSRASLAHLFTTDNNDTSFDQLKKNTNWKVTYKNGMFITISNHKTTYETIRGAYKKQYQSLLHSLGYKVSREDIMVKHKLPTRETIFKLIGKGIPIVVAGIHDNPKEDRDYGWYQHQHLVVYNIHRHLPDPNDTLAFHTAIKRVESCLYRYIGSGSKYKRDGIKIKPVGIGEHHQDQYNTDLYGYLVKSLCDPEEQSIINYINNNRHNPDRDYNLSYIYSSTLASKNGNFN